MNKLSYSFIIFILSSFSIMAQQSAFSTSIYRMQKSPYRNADGTPSANYWQNKADYKVAVELDTKTDVINGNVVIDYTKILLTQHRVLQVTFLQQNKKKKLKVII